LSNREDKSLKNNGVPARLETRAGFLILWLLDEIAAPD
jgi:hypothetical protein